MLHNVVMQLMAGPTVGGSEDVLGQRSELVIEAICVLLALPCQPLANRFPIFRHGGTRSKTKDWVSGCRSRLAWKSQQPTLRSRGLTLSLWAPSTDLSDISPHLSASSPRKHLRLLARCCDGVRVFVSGDFAHGLSSEVTCRPSLQPLPRWSLASRSFVADIQFRNGIVACLSSLGHTTKQTFIDAVAFAPRCAFDVECLRRLF